MPVPEPSHLPVYLSRVASLSEAVVEANRAVVVSHMLARYVAAEPSTPEPLTRLRLDSLETIAAALVEVVDTLDRLNDAEQADAERRALDDDDDAASDTDTTEAGAA
jgi:hypothetical protein